MLFKEITAVYSENHTKWTDILCRKNKELLIQQEVVYTEISEYYQQSHVPYWPRNIKPKISQHVLCINLKWLTSKQTHFQTNVYLHFSFLFAHTTYPQNYERRHWITLYTYHYALKGYKALHCFIRLSVNSSFDPSNILAAIVISCPNLILSDAYTRNNFLY
jgi:hypothetical protein